MLGTPAKIYYKYEGVSPAGSHKPNTAVPQAYYNKQAGIKRLATETGAGQWGSSMAFAGQMFGLAVRVYMVKVSYEQKPFRRSMMQTWGAEVFASPTDHDPGRARCAGQGPEQSRFARHRHFRSGGGSRLPRRYQLRARLRAQPRLLHQTVIGLEAKKQFAKIGEYPDMIFASCGGGSNFAGIAFPFLADKAAGQARCGWWRSSRRPARR